MLAHLCIHQSLKNCLGVGTPAIPKPVHPKPVPMTQQTRLPADRKPGAVKAELPSLFKKERRVKIQNLPHQVLLRSKASNQQAHLPHLLQRRKHNSENTPCAPALLKQIPVSTTVTGMPSPEGVELWIFLGSEDC